MPGLDIAHQRLLNQHIALPILGKASDVVRWLGAVQAQDYAGAKWALGLRLQGATDEVVEKAFTEGSILRTHVMRPTWHFVTPADIRWILALTAPRVNARSAYYYRQVGLDQKIFARSNAALVKALQGGKQLTREELRSVLQRAGIATDGALRLAYIIMRAELDGIVCSGARRGKQFTYSLLDERVPPAKALKRDEALAELVRRYFMSHGPATLQDFVWWSGLTIADARNGLDMVKGGLRSEVIDGQTYWLSTSPVQAKGTAKRAYLLSNYDEYISYKDRSAVFDMSRINDLVFSHLMVIEGCILGTWKRVFKKDAVVVESKSFTPLTKAEHRAVTTAAQAYSAFLRLPVVLA